jgi:signal transduction histidine kinase
MQEEIGVALIPVLTSLLDAIKPILDAFSSLSTEQQAVIVNAVMMVGAVKAVTTALTGLGVAAGTAQAAALPLLALMAAFAAFQAYRSGSMVDNTWLESNYADELERTIGLQGEQLEWGFLALQMRVSQLKGAGELAEGTNVLNEAFRALAEASPATAAALLKTEDAANWTAETHTTLNGILEQTIIDQAGVAVASQESADMINEAALAVSGYSAQWLALQGLLSDRVMWDALDTSFDNLEAKAAAAFGGSEQDVKDFNIAAAQTWAEIDKIVQKLELPEEVQTEIKILYDQGKFDEIYSLLTTAQGGGTVSIRPGKIPGMASGGTVTSSGMALVGENGPELLNLPTGASVIPLTGTTGGGGNTINITVTSADPQAVINAIRNFERRNGSGWRR